MNDISSRGRPVLLVAGGGELNGLLGPLAAYLDALEARVAALERRSSAVRLMTAADAAAYARVNVETILRAVRAGELSVAGYDGRSPRISRDALGSWLAVRSSAGAPVSPRPRRHRGRLASDAVEAAWQALG
jgi:excisionase family DNA binding protein